MDIKYNIENYILIKVLYHPSNSVYANKNTT